MQEIDAEQKNKIENSLFLKFTVKFAMEKISEKRPRRANTIIVHKNCHTLCPSLLSPSSPLSLAQKT